MSINLSKENRINRINLNKEKAKNACESNSALVGLTSRVGLVLDYSGSMDNLYRNGTVQDVIETALPLAMQFDDNGEMECWIFNDNFKRLPDISMDNFYDYVKREILSKYNMGGTSYAPVMKDVFKKYIKEAPANIPNYVMFITDGDNSDHLSTDTAITKYSKYPIFWQFIGVGGARFNYLEKLDSMQGRYVDNANFLKVSKMSDITYPSLLSEYPSWLSEPKVIKMLRG